MRAKASGGAGSLYRALCFLGPEVALATTTVVPTTRRNSGFVGDRRYNDGMDTDGATVAESYLSCMSSGPAVQATLSRGRPGRT